MKQDEAYLIHQLPAEGGSVWADFFCRNAGLLRLRVKGALRNRNFQPFRLYSLQWKTSRALDQLESVPGGSFYLEGKSLYCALYLNELLSHLLPEKEGFPELFHLYQKILEGLYVGQDAETLLRHFELKLLEVLGYALVLSCDDHHEVLEAGRFYCVDPGYLPRRLDEALEGAYSGEDLLAIEARNFDVEGVRQEAKRLLRVWIGHYSGGKTFRSRDFFKSLQKPACKSN